MDLGNGFVFRSRAAVRNNMAKVLAYLCRYPVWLDQITETLKLLGYIYKVKRNWCQAGCIFNMCVLKVNQLIFSMCVEILVAWYCARLLLIVDFRLSD